MTKKKKKRQPYKKSSWIKKILYVLLVAGTLVVGLALVFNQSIANQLVDNYSHSYVDNTTPEEMKANENANVSFDPSNVGALNSTDVLSEYVNNGNNHFTNLPVVGAIAIPDLGMNLPVIKGLDNASLAVGAGTMKDGQKMGAGNYALASHSLFYGYQYNNLLFTPLHRAKAGMTIYMRDSENIYVYKIDKVYVVDPSAGYVAFDSEGDKIVTLVTCTDANATERIIVRGSLEREFPISQAWDELKEYFGSNWTRYW